MKLAKTTLLLVLAGTVLSGCAQPCCLPERDVADMAYRLDLPRDLAKTAPIEPTVQPVPDPPNVLNPEREPQYLTLNEAFALALEGGTVGVQSLRVPGLATDDLLTFTGVDITGFDSVRVLALEPAVRGAAIESALARFDALWTNSLAWTTTDEPTQGLSSFSNGQAAQLRSTLAKPLPTGGVAGITWSTDYLLLSQPPTGAFGVLNPSYTPRLQFGFEQPLWRDFGVGINQVLSSLPFSSLFPEVNRPRTDAPAEGILLARLRFDQQRAEFERAIHFLLLNVEVAYWNLYGAYFNLYASEQSLRQAHEAWRITKTLFEHEKVDLLQVSQTQAQYELFRSERLQAVGRIIDAERTLRLLLGLPPEDGRRLVPIDTPVLAPYQPNWPSAWNDALSLRPELILSRENLKAKQLQLQAAQNTLRPDLRLQGTYTTVGLGSRLDGNQTIQDANGQPVTNNALRSLTSTHFNNWTLGLSLSMPLGFRQEHAVVRQARLELAKSYNILREQELRAETILAKQYSQLIEANKLVEILRLRRQTLSKVLELLHHKFAAGKITATDRSEGDSLLDAQRQWAAALSAEYQAIVEYNNALARFDFARGTTMNRHNVHIAEGPLPACAQVRAIDHERQRAKALLSRQRPPSFVPTGPALVEYCLNTPDPLSAIGHRPSAFGPAASGARFYPSRQPTANSQQPIANSRLLTVLGTPTPVLANDTPTRESHLTEKAPMPPHEPAVLPPLRVVVGSQPAADLAPPHAAPSQPALRLEAAPPILLGPPDQGLETNPE